MVKLLAGILEQPLKSLEPQRDSMLGPTGQSRPTDAFRGVRTSQQVDADRNHRIGEFREPDQSRDAALKDRVDQSRHADRLEQAARTGETGESPHARTDQVRWRAGIHLSQSVDWTNEAHQLHPAGLSPQSAMMRESQAPG
jgi:hypothetical protein